MGVGFFSIDILRMYRVYRENTERFSSIQYILMRTLKRDNFVKKGFFKIEFVIMSFDLKIVSDDFDVENMNGDFVASRLSVKNVFFFFYFMLKLQNAKIKNDACILIDFW